MSLGVVALATLSGCARAGGSCDEDRAVRCADDETALVCVNRTWKELPCRGTMGCRSGSCENNWINKEGEPCVKDGDAACSSSRSAQLKCEGGVWVKDHDCAGSCKTTPVVICIEPGS